MDPTTITREIDLDTPAEDLWHMVSDPEGLAHWLGDAVDVDVRPGGAGTVVDDGIVRDVVVEEVHAPRHLAFTWWEHDDRSTASRVVFSIGTTADGRSRLTIAETQHHRTPGPVATASVSASATRWEVRALALWASTVAVVAVR